MQDRGFYTVQQAADTLDLTPGLIRQMLRGGDLEGSKEPGERGWRITRESVEEVRRRRRDRENRRLLAAALERIPPQLEASAEERESDIGETPTRPYRGGRMPSDGNLAAAEEHLAAPFR